MSNITTFGTTTAGQQVDVITITSGALTAKILTYGAVLNDVRMAGVDHPLTLGSSDIAAYEGKMGSFGSLIGPVANRINGAKAAIGGVTHHFELRNGQGYTLHSGSKGCQNQVWSVTDHSDTHVTLTITLPDGQAGFPGHRVVTATYRITGATLSLTIDATTDEATLFNFANHSYWSLDASVGFSGYSLTVLADHYTATGDTLCPTGETPDVTDTPFDFRTGAELSGDDTQFLDTNFCLSSTRVPLRPVATLRGTSGIQMQMATTEPGLQVFDCGTINAPGFTTHHGDSYGPYSAPALEAQSWPDAPNHRHFPSIVHGPKTPYHQITEWTFSQA